MFSVDVYFGFTVFAIPFFCFMTRQMASRKYVREVIDIIDEGWDEIRPFFLCVEAQDDFDPVLEGSGHISFIFFFT